jgi:uncharacterized membrane protein
VAKGCRFDLAPDCRSSQDQRRARRLFGERQAVTERDRDRALLEIQSEMKPRRNFISSQPMDLIIAKWFVYVVIGLAVAYLWVHFDEVRSAYRTLTADFWR